MHDLPTETQSVTLAAHTSPLLRTQLNRIWGGSITLIVTLALLFAGYGVIDFKAQRVIAEQEAEEIAEMTALNSENMLKLTHQVLSGMEQVLKHSADTGTPHSVSIRNTLLNWKARNPHLMDLLVVDIPGTITQWTASGIAPDVSDRQYIKHHLQNPESHLYVGEPQLSRVHDGKWFFGVSEPVRNTAGSIEQILVATIDLDAIRTPLEFAFSIPGSTQALISRDGMLYMRIPDNMQNRGKHFEFPPETAQLPINATSGTFTMHSPIDNKERIVAFRKLHNQPLYALGSVSINAALSLWYERLGLVITLWLTLATITVWFSQKLATAVRAHEFLANTDSLTGIYNRRSLLGIAEETERRGERTRQLAVLMIDVDHFKQINDRQGHASGDTVLCQVAEMLQKNCRENDLLGRYGGEEFLAILNNTPAEGAMKLAEKLRQAVSTITTTEGPITVSIGVAIPSSASDTLDDTIRRADKAMYAAKAAGRNRVMLAD